MLDDRKTAILRAVVEEYIATAQPVGSSHIAANDGVQVSSATVRNDMAFLEQEGYLAQPHTSAGRIPTDKGYRHFVDSISTAGVLASEDATQVGDFFKATHGRLEDLLRHTTTLLADITHQTAVIVGPEADTTIVRAVHISRVTSRTATVVVVLSNHNVENDMIQIMKNIQNQNDSEIFELSIRLRPYIQQ